MVVMGGFEPPTSASMSAIKAKAGNKL